MRPHATRGRSWTRVLLLSTLVLFWVGPAQVQAAFAPVILPDPESGNVQGASLAADGTRLVTWYCHHDASTNTDDGYLQVWNGSAWSNPLGRDATFECHSPDVAVHGDLIFGTFQNDSQDTGMCLECKWCLDDQRLRVCGSSQGVEAEGGLRVWTALCQLLSGPRSDRTTSVRPV